MDTRFDLVMFDLDGTLVDTAPEIQDAINDLLDTRHMPLASLDQVRGWIGHGTRELLVQALARGGLGYADTVRASESFEPLARQFDMYYQGRVGSRSQLYAGAREVLTTLRARGTRLALVTNKEAKHVMRLLQAHQLAPLFDRVVCGDTLPTRKPDPAGIHSCLAAFGTAPARALFVGDSSIDVAAARNAGVAMWAVPHGYNMGQPIAAARPDRVIDSLSWLLADDAPASHPSTETLTSS